MEKVRVIEFNFLNRAWLAIANRRETDVIRYGGYKAFINFDGRKKEWLIDFYKPGKGEMLSFALANTEINLVKHWAVCWIQNELGFCERNSGMKIERL